MSRLVRGCYHMCTLSESYGAPRDERDINNQHARLPLLYLLFIFMFSPPLCSILIYLLSFGFAEEFPPSTPPSRPPSPFASLAHPLPEGFFMKDWWLRSLLSSAPGPRGFEACFPVHHGL